jgi:hypothetical protein
MVYAPGPGEDGNCLASLDLRTNRIVWTRKGFFDDAVGTPYGPVVVLRDEERGWCVGHLDEGTGRTLQLLDAGAAPKVCSAGDRVLVQTMDTIAVLAWEPR